MLLNAPLNSVENIEEATWAVTVAVSTVVYQRTTRVYMPIAARLSRDQTRGSSTTVNSISRSLPDLMYSIGHKEFIDWTCVRTAEANECL